jgi:hypothetical protein
MVAENCPNWTGTKSIHPRFQAATVKIGSEIYAWHFTLVGRIANSNHHFTLSV